MGHDDLVESEQLLGVHVRRGGEQRRLDVARGEIGVVVEGSRTMTSVFGSVGDAFRRGDELLSSSAP